MFPKSDARLHISNMMLIYCCSDDTVEFSQLLLWLHFTTPISEVEMDCCLVRYTVYMLMYRHYGTQAKVAQLCCIM